MGTYVRAATGLGVAVWMVLSLATARAAAPDTVNDTASSTTTSKVDNAVVKVFSTLRHPDLYQPWTRQAPSEVTGSGVVIEGNRILTNAHVVQYASQVQIQGNQAGDKLAATVEAIAPGIDLAVLKLDDPSFFDTHAALARANALPAIKDAVLAYGFPTGGNSLAITKGIVSRIEFTLYNYPVSGLRIQIDAAINPGNSGGPATDGDKMIGLAFSRLNDAQNIGYIIPNEEIELFLKDVADGHYDGKPTLFDDFQTLENPALRDFLKLDKSVSGIVVHKPFQPTAAYPLKEWDVITQIGDEPIDDQGRIALGPDLRVGFVYWVQKAASDGIVPLSIIRDGKPMQIRLPVSANKPVLMPSLNGSYPPYFIYGPIVFSKATLQFLGFLNTKDKILNFNAIHSPLLSELGEPPTPDRNELVVISSPFFSSPLTNGYANPSGAVVYSINGMRIRNLGQLVALLRDLKDDFVSIELENRGGEALVFRRKEMLAATDGILADNGVRAQGSPDMLEIWQGKSAK